ncbi:MAG: L-histidine N(alpha)-methyltransferase [Candidatus Eremiobacteraeota bacterium]|nr:L-histidine N(alpha)-methyltransferase [Candidatus Eremiobacteraeota bacterium]
MVTRISDRLEIVSPSKLVDVATFDEDVRRGLTTSPKRLSSKYFYDELGSAIFECIMCLPEYYLTRAESEILRDYSWEIVRSLTGKVEFLELGSGSAIKTRLLIEEALRVQDSLHYSPIDISREALGSTAKALVSSYEKLSVRAYAGDYFALLGTPQLQFHHRVLALYLGSNIGNYEPHAARTLLSAVAASLRADDGLLLSADLKKDRKTLELAYNDPTGVTAAFNKNLLGRINRELAADFDLSEYAHIVHYDEGSGCVKSYLEARRPQQVSIGGSYTASFQTGERIHTESSYKFSREDIASLARSTGFSLERTWLDKKARFSVNLLIRK